ncbi:MAG: MaoC family dehydratase N-terminal domain-containing protein [Chloroflexi bacterium]|nr:MaoC family dehydratase N-terminal domain-containing protein [Chloroflexota bacterium]
MSEESPITPEIKAMVGKEKVYKDWDEIGRGIIKRFALAIDDKNALYLDEEFAKKSRYEGITAPPTMLFELNHQIGAELGEDGTPRGAWGRLPPPFKNVMRGGNEYEFYQPVRPGDVVTTINRTVDIFEREGKSGLMVFVINELTYYNQRGEKLGLNRETMIYPYKKA